MMHLKCLTGLEVVDVPGGATDAGLVTFGEDRSRIRKGHADANFSLLRRTLLSLLKNNKSKNIGVKNKRLPAAWDDNYRLKFLCVK